MKGKTLIIAGITVAVLIVCFIVYNTHSNTEVESEQIAVVFSTDKMGLIETFEGTINDLYKEMQVKAKTAEEEPDIQEIVEAGEIDSDTENEESLSKDESTENPSGGGDLTATQPAPAPQPSGGLTPEQQAYLDSLGGGGYIPETPPAGENSGSNHGITMAQ